MRRFFPFIVAGLICGCGVQPNPPAPAALPKSNTTTRIDDPELDAAIAKAKQSLDQFIARLEKPQRGEVFSVESEFPAPDGSHEHLWIGDVSYKDGKFSGTITSKPTKVPVKVGDQMSVAKDAVTDWMILKSGKQEGGYTVDLLLKREGQPR